MSKKTTKQVRVVKRFVISKKLVESDEVLSFTNSKGDTYEYSPKKVWSQIKDRIEVLPCWEKYGNYTNRTNLPKFVRELDALV
jgi:hypothetical protein